MLMKSYRMQKKTFAVGISIKGTLDENAFVVARKKLQVELKKNNIRNHTEPEVVKEADGFFTLYCREK